VADTWPLRGKVAIVGIGYSNIARRQKRPLGLLARDAAMAAIADAGISAEDLDGLSTYPDMPVRGSSGGSRDGVDIVSVHYMMRMLGIDKNVQWYNQNSAGLFPSTIIEAVNAIASGACTTALVWRAMHMPDQGRYFGWTEPTVPGEMQFVVPYGVLQPLVRTGLDYRAYLSRFATDRRALGEYLVQNRQNTHRNPNAVFRDTPLELDEYLDAPMIADPMCRFDCDMPVDGCIAFVLTRAEIAESLQNTPAYVRGYGQVTKQGNHFFAVAGDLDYLWACGESLAEKLWSTSGLSAADLQVAQIYDGFSPFILLWLESLGIAERGTACKWLLAGNGAPDGSLPLNTSGGSLGEGRLHGGTHIAEAVRQVTGRAGERQITNATHALVTVGQLTANSGGLVLSAER
jgi:acetyl-CoA acetyltransferase